MVASTKSPENTVTSVDIKKEPSLTYIQQCDMKYSKELMEGNDAEPSNLIATISFVCRTIRIGSYKFIPLEKVKYSLLLILDVTIIARSR